MARRRKVNKQTHDNKLSGAGPIENHSVGMGTPLGVILEPEKSRMVDDSCSSAKGNFNNRSTPSNVITKACHTQPSLSNSYPTIFITNMEFLQEDQKQLVITVNNIALTIDVIPDSRFQKKECLLHSIESWQEERQLAAYQVFANGNIPKRMYSRPTGPIRGNKVTFCLGCNRSSCMVCSVSICHAILHDKYVPELVKQNHSWVRAITLFKNIPPSDKCTSVLRFPPTVSHCCCLRKGSAKICNHRKKIRQSNKRLQIPAKDNSNQAKAKTNDGLLHYAPYRIVIPPSFRFFEALSVAEQGNKKSEWYQAPVYHSVIPNDVARDYDYRNIYPEGNFKKIIDSDYFFYLPNVPVPYSLDKRCIPFVVRRVCVKFSEDYKQHPKNGSYTLSDEEYFRSCCIVLDEEWENNDIKNMVDCCIVTGVPSTSDKGINEIMLACRIYTPEFAIPDTWNFLREEFFDACFERTHKSGYETQRFGGSAGEFGAATIDQLRYFKESSSCFPNIAAAVVHIPVDGGKWRAYYISPYGGDIKQSVSVHPYSTPRPGGKIEYDDDLSRKYPDFFHHLSRFRSIIPEILIALQESKGICISPYAVETQVHYNQIAAKLCCDIVSPREYEIEFLKLLSKQVVYSLVAYTVGNHQDVTSRGVAKEFIECKACLRWNSKSNPAFVDIALGRGGSGPGVYTMMIVDHPKKKNT